MMKTLVCGLALVLGVSSIGSVHAAGSTGASDPKPCTIDHVAYVSGALPRNDCSLPWMTMERGWGNVTAFSLTGDGSTLTGTMELAAPLPTVAETRARNQGIALGIFFQTAEQEDVDEIVSLNGPPVTWGDCMLLNPGVSRPWRAEGARWFLWWEVEPVFGETSGFGMYTASYLGETYLIGPCELAFAAPRWNVTTELSSDRKAVTLSIPYTAEWTIVGSYRKEIVHPGEVIENASALSILVDEISVPAFGLLTSYAWVLDPLPDDSRMFGLVPGTHPSLPTPACATNLLGTTDEPCLIQNPAGPGFAPTGLGFLA